MERSTSWRRFRRRRGIIIEEGQEKKLKKNIFVILFCILSFSVFSATPSDEKTEKWIIAPQKFSGKVEYQEMIPTMILQSFPENMTRDISPEEQLFYYEKAQNDKMKELISGLSKYENDKNQLFFKNISKSEKNKQREKIEENIKNQEAEIQKLQAEMLEPVEYHEETRFVEISENFVSDDFLTKLDSNNQKINAVLSGSVSEINGFLYIKAKITILPLEKNPETEDLQGLFSMETAVVGNYSEIQQMTNEIAQNFLSFVLNKEKVLVSVKVFPEEISSTVSITIDGTVYKTQVDNLSLQQGEHKFSIEAPGYQVRNFTANLDDSRSAYNYSVYLSPAEEIPLTVVGSDKELLKSDMNPEDVSLYIQGIKKSITFSDSELESSFYASHLPVFGEFTVPLVTDPEEETKYASTFFKLTGNSIKPISIRSESSTVLIEKARKRMYTSYGILLITLPLTFYSNGRLSDIVNTINNSSSYSDEMLKSYDNWRLTYEISLGATIAAGVNMLIQLGRYIFTANTVLPQSR